MSLRSSALALSACLTLCAPSSAQNPESVFHHAYFLENERGHFEEALALYQQVAQSREASAALQAEAKERVVTLTEEVASLDLARLMPPEAILYAELSQPGQAILKVLSQLGLAGSFEEAAAKGSFAIRPEAIRRLAGIRGMAVALTSVSVDGNAPGGVLVLNVGDMDILRGLLEAGILAQGAPEDPIEGMPSWSVESKWHVSVGRRLMVAATDRAQIAAVLRRLSGQEKVSLLSSSTLGPQLEKRAGSPLFLCVNAVPLRPILQGWLASQGGGPPQALLGAALDLSSLKALVARVAVGDDGLALEADLFLEEDHRNLVFNLLRRAPLDPVLLERIPKGAAAFVAGAFNERGPAIAPLDRNAQGAPVVTALDFGRELFANLAGFAFFVLPGGAPVPSAALVLSSNDPERTGAVLELLLGLGNVLATGQAVGDQTNQIGGAPTRTFHLPLGIPLYLTTQENTLILSPSEELIEEAFEGRSNGNSVLHDEAFAAELGRLGRDTTLTLCAHLGRTLAVAQPFAGPKWKEIEPLAAVLTHTVVALQTRHSGTQFGLGLALQGIPRVEGLVGQALKERRGRPEVASEAPKHEGLMAGFARLATRGDGGEAARAFARQQMALIADDPRALNNFAWALLTEKDFAERYDDLAKEYALASNEASHYAVWQYLDTLALAHFRSGQIEQAIRFEEQALGLVEAAADRSEVAASLARFRATQGTLADESGKP